MTRYLDVVFSDPLREMMLLDLCQMATKFKNFTTPDCETFQLNNFESALHNSVSSFTKKSLFLMDS